MERSLTASGAPRTLHAFGLAFALTLALLLGLNPASASERTSARFDEGNPRSTPIDAITSTEGSPPDFYVEADGGGSFVDPTSRR